MKTRGNITKAFRRRYCAVGDIITLDKGLDFRAENYRQKLADGLRFIASHEGPYLIHCNEGKDRTGFVTAMLEALIGADAREIAAGKHDTGSHCCEDTVMTFIKVLNRFIRRMSAYK